jgi:glutathione synthase/RimK-type ligase-like ATP-grasp enzyme
VTTVMLTLGRLPKALDLARSFAEAGCRVIIAEPFRRHLAGASRAVAKSLRVPAPSEGQQRYLAELARIAEAEQVDWIVPVSEETLHVAFLRDMLPERTRLFTMPPQLVLEVHDKRRFAEKAAALGLAVPETHQLGAPGAFALAAASDVVVKPLHACSGRGVRIVRRGDALPAPEPKEPAIVQRFVAGQEHSTCTIAQHGRVVATIVYRGLMMSGSVAIAFERVEQPAITAWVERFVAATGWTGFIAFDFILDGDGTPLAIECNPRSTSGLHFLDRGDLAPAILGDDATRVVRARPEVQLQQAYSCLTETWAALMRGEGLRGNLRRLFALRDVTWDRGDPMPFLTMTFTSWPIIRLSIQRGTSFGQVATLDVGWFEDARGAA